MNALALVLLLCAQPAAADMSLVRIAESKSRRGRDGAFAKTWVEVSGRRMRIVSGSARKIRDGRAPDPAPSRLIEIVDLDAASAVRLDPDTRAYEERPLKEPLDDGSLQGRLGRGGPAFSVVASTVAVREGAAKRRFKDALCDHWIVTVRLRLKGPRGRAVHARMSQDLWMAPVQGEMQKGLLDILAFESEYRRLTGGALSPLDLETYQAAEAAAYLRVPEGELRSALEKVKDRLSDVPGYPVSSVVSWWREGERAAKAPAREAARASKPAAEERDAGLGAVGQAGRRDLRPPKRRLPPLPNAYPLRIRIDIAGLLEWGSWIRSAVAPAGRRGPRPVVIVILREPEEPQSEKPESRLEMPREAAGRPQEGPQAPSEERFKAGRSRPVPFHEVFTRMDALLYFEELPQEHFAPPPGYARKG